MIYEGVNFNEAAIKGMKRATFDKIHATLWPDRDIETRNKMLGEVYDLINGPAKSKKKKSDD